MIQKSLWRVRPRPHIVAPNFCYYSTPAYATTPPMLTQLRKDMIAAMKAKDAARLDVIRGLMAEATNASKTASPITTDMHVLNLMRKRVQSSEAAIEEFVRAGRIDLKDKEAAQKAILDEYIEGANVMRDEDIIKIIEQLLHSMRSQKLKLDRGSIMKGLFAPGGGLDGQLVDRKSVAALVDGIL